jgi:hypothetical protein
MSAPSTLADHPRIRWLFIVAAIWNLSAAGIALAFPDFHAESFYRAGTDLTGHVARMNTQAFWVSVLLFGAGYLVVARDPHKNHGLVFLAAVGKTYVFAIWTIGWFQSEVTVLALAGAIGDLAFAAVFAWFLVRVRRESSAPRRA